MAHLQVPCLPRLSIKLKYLCLAHRKHPDQAHLWMATGKKNLTHSLWSLDRTRKYLQQLISFFKLYLLTLHPPTIKETSIQTWERWFFRTLVHHLPGLMTFWIKLLFPALTPHLLIDWPVLQQAVLMVTAWLIPFLQTSSPNSINNRMLKYDTFCLKLGSIDTSIFQRSSMRNYAKI